MVAQQLAAPKPSGPKITRVTYAGGRAVTELPTLGPERAEAVRPVPSEKKKSESP
jgi:hypothetical protein